MENILTDGYCLSPYTCQRCTVFKQFDELNFDGPAQKHQNSPRQNFALYSILDSLRLLLLPSQVPEYDEK